MRDAVVDRAVERGSRVSSTGGCASSSGSFLPVSIHQPSSTSWRTRWPWSMSHWMASVISSSPRGRRGDGPHGLVDRAVEQVDADEREVRRRVGGLLDEAHDVAVVVELGDAEAVRVRHRGPAGSARPAAARRRWRRRGAGRASNGSTNSTRPCWSMLSPRYITKSSSPRKSPAMSTQWARPSGCVLGDVGDLRRRTASRRRPRP